MTAAARSALGRLTQPSVYLPVAFGIVFLTAWELYGRAMNPLLFAPPSAVIEAAGGLIESGRLQEAIVITLTTLAVGVVISIITGIAVGVALGRMPALSDVVEPYIDGIYATPRIVLTPLIIIWFGIGFWGRVFVIWLGTAIPIMLSTAIGVRHSRPDLIEVGRSFQASERDLLRHVILPGAVPYVLTGIKIGMGRALIGVVIAEMFLDLTGIGGIIRTEASRFRVPEALLGVLIFAILGTILLGAVGALERRFSAWKQEGA
ncbi:MAG TPA: ABC transporter permease [Candidatus Limnocylindria bacterium]|nr:ABC transporter permease [Candidatus Limnocylindria bacterium]